MNRFTPSLHFFALPETTMSGSDPHASRSHSPFTRRRFLGVGSALAVGTLTTGALGAFPSAALAAAPAAGAGPVDLSPAHWIWYPDGKPGSAAPAGHRYFRKDFTVASGE